MKCVFFFSAAFLTDLSVDICIIKQSYVRYSFHIKTHTPENILKIFRYFLSEIKNLEYSDTFSETSTQQN